MSSIDTEIYHAREFCKLTGITAETLRHYVEKGIVTPSGVEANNYKVYSQRDIFDMLLARNCRGLNLSIPTILTRTTLSLEEQEAIFIDREREIEQEIVMLKFAQERVRQQQGNLRFISSLLGKVREFQKEEMFSLYRLILFRRGAGISIKEQSTLEQWMKYPQYTCVALNAPRENLADPSADTIPISFGVAVREQWAHSLRLNTAPPVSYFEGKHSLCTVIATYNPFELRKADLNGIFETVDSLGAEIVSDLTGLLCTYTDTPKGRLYYCSLGFSIK